MPPKRRDLPDLCDFAGSLRRLRERPVSSEWGEEPYVGAALCYAAVSMASFKKTLAKQGIKLMTDPRIAKLLQDERVMKAVVQMMSVPGKVQTFASDQKERLAKAMRVATEDEVKDLRRQIRRLEEELARVERDKGKRG